ncbi:rhodanese-like protein [Sphingobacterium spiritivorum ATCC 33300]|uniref:Rhodanese-like protein n=1 Tax=Sphingobacterium spiritivorum ATCC 33300 TaxID=525372 RepID=C2FYP0_SPHSI|nr:rhodanese-like domain-containing protein [Sphingobacterium spiritivorum]EEI91986.1 rhodanese-like protein [Sphingobacterium spiritivorum ATCC 33300]QQS96475.1 rhodanese-like domain-containing protein [Sphingobacterium spiritivorum]
MDKIIIRQIYTNGLVFLWLLLPYAVHAQQNGNRDAEHFRTALLTDSTIQLIDVRTPGEYAEGAIVGSILLNWKDSTAFEQGIQKLAKNRPVYLYCRSGNRSRQAADRLISLGFKEVINLSGGIKAWEEKGYLLKKDTQDSTKEKGDH